MEVAVDVLAAAVIVRDGGGRGQGGRWCDECDDGDCR